MDLKSADLELIDVRKLYGSVAAVEQVSFRLTAGEVVALLGPSGCGKTTTLRMIAGLVHQSSGDIRIGGKSISNIPVHRRNIGMLFQSYALFPHISVEQNVAFGLEMRHIPRADIQRRVNEVLSLVQLQHLSDRLPSALSGGQQQRVALARALVIEPSVLLLDEPLGALDKGLRETMQVELRQLQQRLGITTVIVTHDQEEALTLADKIVIMRDGRVEQVGTPLEIYARPVSRFVAGFIGASNFLRGRAGECGGRETLIELGGGAHAVVSDPLASSAEVMISLRPESISVEVANGNAISAPNTAFAVVEQVIYRGAYTQLYLRLDNAERILALHRNKQGEGDPRMFAVGQRVTASWPQESNLIVRDD